MPRKLLGSLIIGSLIGLGMACNVALHPAHALGIFLAWSVACLVGVYFLES